MPRDFFIPPQVVLPQKISVIALSLIEVRWEYVALPGTYKAEGQHPDGVFFFGTGRSIVEISELYKNQLRLKMGGIYIPHNPTQAPRLFYLLETDVQTTESLEKYIDQRNTVTFAAPVSGKVADSNAIGNVIGGAVVGALIAPDVGKITLVPTAPDATVSSAIRAAHSPASSAPVAPAATK